MQCGDSVKVDILEGGIVERTGALGPVRSVYFRAPMASSRPSVITFKEKHFT